VKAEDYPYTGAEGVCSYNSSQGLVSANGFSFTLPNSPFSMQAGVIQGPTAARVSSSSTYFQTYSGGIMTDSNACGDFLDHTVTIVGYSAKDQPTPYWIVKNSWGTTWGDEGYAYIAITDGPGVCGINQATSFPNINLMPGPIEFGSIVACLSFGLFVIFPISYWELKNSIKRFHHPAQKAFGKTLIFEGISFGLCWFMYMVTIFTNTTNYQFRQMVVFVFYCSIHLTYLSLHNCLALKSLF